MFAFYENHQEQEAFRRMTIQNFDFPSHLHKETEIVYITEGRCILHIEHQQYELTKGMIAVIFPHCVHSYHARFDYEATIYLLDSVFLSDYEALLTAYCPETPIFESSVDMKSLLQQTEPLSPTANYRQYFLQKALWQLIFAQFLQVLELRKRASENLSLTHQILSYIDTHYREPLSADSVAEALHSNVYTISKIFSNKIEMSFPLYLAHLRISHAKQLLETTTLSILEIALQSGFETQRSFNRHFINQTQTTPRVYRSNYLSH